jgi:hypothetical protein
MTRDEQFLILQQTLDTAVETIDDVQYTIAERIQLVYELLKPEKWGCMTKGAANYDPEATLPGPCEFIAVNPEE